MSPCSSSTYSLSGGEAGDLGDLSRTALDSHCFLAIIPLMRPLPPEPVKWSREDPHLRQEVGPILLKANCFGMYLVAFLLGKLPDPLVHLWPLIALAGPLLFPPRTMQYPITV